VKLDADTLQALAVAATPRAYLRVVRLAHRATPLGMGFGRTRFSSPKDRFKLLYAARTLPTALAETVIRDRFERRRRRRVHVNEVAAWGVTEITALSPLKLVDLRTDGAFRLGVSTDAPRARNQRSGRALSQAIHDQCDADGLLYLSRLTGEPCVAVYERAAGPLAAGPVIELASLARLVPALEQLGVEVVRTV
jgi:hypothetical protein